MHFVSLRFAENKAARTHYMNDHKQWLERGFERGLFVLAGSLDNGEGGCLLVQHTRRSDLEKLLSEDPFVRHRVVQAQITSFEPSQRAGSLASGDEHTT